jgi:3-oxoacyl-[acyl-carrier protein] reductase
MRRARRAHGLVHETTSLVRPLFYPSIGTGEALKRREGQKTSSECGREVAVGPSTVLGVVDRSDRYRSRAVIVTGGSRGVGRTAVQRLAHLGYAVAVNYLHDQQAAEATVDAVLEARGAAVAIRADVADELDVERLFAQTIETFGAIDAVVHSVRGQVVATSVAGAGLDDVDEMYRTNTRAVFLVNRCAASQVREGGAIVNVFSSAATSAWPAYGVFATNSAAVEKLTQVLSVELQERDITVNGVSVGVDEPCTPTVIVDVITYLLSRDGHGITGHIIHLGGRAK